MSDVGLHDRLKKLSERAYAPYSKFHVAAILVDADGREAAGVNVENVSYGLTSCAERNAVFRFVADGLKKPAVLHLYAGVNRMVTPCGACRQVLLEFDPDMVVIMYNEAGEAGRLQVRDLVPYPFTVSDLGADP